MEHVYRICSLWTVVHPKPPYWGETVLKQAFFFIYSKLLIKNKVLVFDKSTRHAGGLSEKFPSCPFVCVLPMSQYSLLYVTQQLALHLSNLFYQPPPNFAFLASHPCLTSLGPLHPTAPLLLSPIYVIVTVQLYLSHSTKRTGTSSCPTAPAVKARSAANRQQNLESSKAGTARKGGATRKTPSFSLQLRKSGSLSSYCSIDTPSYVSPVKSPSQYFQICY